MPMSLFEVRWAQLRWLRLRLTKEAKRAKVFVTEDQQSIAIGRAGQNVRLASRLTGFRT